MIRCAWLVIRLLDSLVVLPHLPMPAARRASPTQDPAPACPAHSLAVARPEWRVVLAESSEKKTAFLRQAARLRAAQRRSPSGARRGRPAHASRL
jgi:hypothetical protein